MVRTAQSVIHIRKDIVTDTVFHLRTQRLALCVGVLLLTTMALMPTTHAVAGQQILPPTSNTWEAAIDWRPVVINPGSSFMMWYSGEGDSGVDNIGLATSNDGISWTRYSQNPVLQVGYSGQWDSGSVNEAWVIQQGGQYKMWYSGQRYNTMTHKILAYSIGYATSPDGINWAKYSGNPVFTVGTSGSWDDKYVWRPIVISTGSSYNMYYEGEGTNGYDAVGMATSPDGINWTRGQSISLPKETWDAFNYELTSVTAVIGGYVMAYDGWASKSTSNVVMGDRRQIGFATSTDGISSTSAFNNPP